MRKLRAERDQERVDVALIELERVCRSSENVLPATLECVKAYATTGEIAGVWRAALGNYRPEVVRL